MASAKPAGYKLATYKSAEGPRAGLIVGEDVFDAAKLTGKPAYATVLGILADWKAAEGALRKAAAGAAKSRAKRQPLKKTKLLAPVQCQRRDLLRRRQLCRSRRGHGGAGGQSAAARSAQPGAETLALPQGAAHHRGLGHADQDLPLRQGHGLGNRACRRHRPAGQGRAEGESARLCRRLHGLQRPFGARPRPSAAVAPTSPFKMDWTKHKTFEGSCPIGPWIVPASDIADPQNLGLKLWVNGELKQDSNTGKMLFTLAEQIEQLSINMTLHPGDLILTGTPSGTGAESGTFLKAGDVVKLWIEKIGEIENRMA